jgi:hypothetical protein
VQRGWGLAALHNGRAGWPRPCPWVNNPPGMQERPKAALW